MAALDHLWNGIVAPATDRELELGEDPCRRENRRLLPADQVGGFLSTAVVGHRPADLGGCNHRWPRHSHTRNRRPRPYTARIV
jgi:hypothetical protein